MMFQIANTLSHAIAIERTPELRAAMCAQLELTSAVELFVDRGIREQGIDEKYINWDTSITGEYPDFKLCLNIVPYKGVVVLDVFSPIRDQFGAGIFQGFELVITHIDQDRPKDNGVIEINCAYIEHFEAVEALFALSPLERIDFVKVNDDPSDPESPYSSDAAAETTKRLVQEIPIPEIAEFAGRGAAVPGYGNMSLCWFLDDFENIIRIDENGEIKGWDLKVPALNRSFYGKKDPPISVEQFFEELQQEL